MIPALQAGPLPDIIKPRVLASFSRSQDQAAIRSRDKALFGAIFTASEASPFSNVAT